MNTELPSSAGDLLAQLQAIFPTFDLSPVEDPEWWEAPSLHSVMSEFLSYFAKHAEAASDRQLGELGQLLAVCTSQASPLENAIDTCFVEHLRQVGVERHLRRYLAKACREIDRRV